MRQIMQSMQVMRIMLPSSLANSTGISTGTILPVAALVAVVLVVAILATVFLRRRRRIGDENPSLGKEEQELNNM